MSVQNFTFQMSQLTSFASLTPQFIFTTRKYHNKHRKNSANTSKGKETKILCEESFNETVKNMKQLPLELHCSVQSLNSLQKNVLQRSHWRTSYVSGQSFLQNKIGISPDQLFEPHLVQVRCFKTDHSVTSEHVRNPGMFARFKRGLGLEMKTSKKAASLHPSITTTEIFDAQKFKTLIEENPTLPQEDKQRLKVAFAEGYLAGHNVNKPAGTKSTVQKVIFFLIFISLVLYVVANSSVNFRIQIGNKTEVDPEEINITFKDVRGVDEAKQELQDIVEFLKNPEKFQTLGGKLPKGVLLVGPPGTGKTMLARAVAGEAGVPFFHVAGPEFDEVLVGQGARRVRDLFKAAKDRTPCVVFIDEIDSVGAKRTNSVLHPYANQTINQLLSEMDGFHQNEGVVVLGATNRRDDLDKALLRPGRFDIEVNVPPPDYTGRKEILDLYLGRIISKNIDVDTLARGTTGFTGADLENMVNQAALRAAIDGVPHVSMKYMEYARDKVLMGPERKSRLPDEETNRITAYHEGGHAVVAFFTKDSHPLHKVTIIPRGVSLGHTAYIPEKERYHVTKSQLMAMMDTMMGGRAAEELVFGAEKVTSGASSDLVQATSIATHMVTEFGMSEKAGLRSVESTNKFNSSTELSPATLDQIDMEIKRILQESYDRAKAILKAHSKEHKLLAEALLKYETLDIDDIKSILNNSEVPQKS
uniref:ATP-dependent zinc metalloprotease YME1 homolog n=1 Tax=Cacopsylla melanoneura TaxID=428564 RepID=A0A8D9A4E9_9HEMI